MNRNYYNINYRRLGILLIPAFLRKDIINAFISAFMQPLSVIQRQFINYVNSIDTGLYSQTCRMEGLLNDLFDYYNRQIHVRTTDVNPDDFLIKSEALGSTLMLGTEPGNTEILVKMGYLGTNSIDFEIVFPVGYSLTADEEKQIRSIINQNKLASKKFDIVYE